MLRSALDLRKNGTQSKRSGSPLPSILSLGLAIIAIVFTIGGLGVTGGAAGGLLILGFLLTITSLMLGGRAIKRNLPFKAMALAGVAISSIWAAVNLAIFGILAPYFF